MFCCTNFFTVAAPIPEAPPVIKATLLSAKRAVDSKRQSINAGILVTLGVNYAQKIGFFMISCQPASFRYAIDHARELLIQGNKKDGCKLYQHLLDEKDLAGEERAAVVDGYFQNLNETDLEAQLGKAPEEMRSDLQMRVATSYAKKADWKKAFAYAKLAMNGYVGPKDLFLAKLIYVFNCYVRKRPCLTDRVIPIRQAIALQGEDMQALWLHTEAVITTFQMEVERRSQFQYALLRAYAKDLLTKSLALNHKSDSIRFESVWLTHCVDRKSLDLQIETLIEQKYSDPSLKARSIHWLALDCVAYSTASKKNPFFSLITKAIELFKRALQVEHNNAGLKALIMRDVAAHTEIPPFRVSTVVSLVRGIPCRGLTVVVPENNKPYIKMIRSGVESANDLQANRPT